LILPVCIISLFTRKRIFSGAFFMVIFLVEVLISIYWTSQAILSLLIMYSLYAKAYPSINAMITLEREVIRRVLFFILTNMSKIGVIHEHGYSHRSNSARNGRYSISSSHKCWTVSVSEYISLYYRKTYIDNNSVLVSHLRGEEMRDSSRAHYNISVLREFYNVRSTRVAACHRCSSINT
jgi:hypothetical protein